MASNIVQSYTVKMEVPENEENEFDITLQDFPFICLVCFGRTDLRLFEEEYCLWDLFLMLTKIEDHSSVDFPRNVCNSCINKLEDISLFIDISRYNNPIFLEKMFPIRVEELSVRIPEEVIEKGRSKYCRVCLCTSNLSPFEEKPELLQLFQECTKIDVKAITNYWKVNSICDKCAYELQKASVFISLSVRNNGILQRLTPVDIKEEMLDSDMDIHPNIIIKEDVFDDSSNRSLIETETCEDLHTSINIKQEVFDDTFIISPSSRFRSGIVSFDQTYPEEKSYEQILGQHENPIKTDSHKLSEHISKKILGPHSSKESLKCNRCEKSFCRNYILQRHILTHTVEEPHTCGDCGKYFSLKTSLKRHLLICSNKSSIQKGNLQSKYNLRGHSLNCTGMNSIQKEKKHTTVFKDEKPSKCNLYEKSFGNEIRLKRHLLTNTKESPFKCNSCDYNSKWKHDLQRHSLNCSKMNSGQEEKQNSSTHEDENPFRCDICEKSFSLNFLLKRHSLTHTEENPFKCKSCDYSSKWKHNLQRHSLNCSKMDSAQEEKPNSSIHEDENQFKCDICEKSFSNDFFLKRHSVTHTEETPFKCIRCDYSSKWKYNLKRHSLNCNTPNDKKPFKCKSCDFSSKWKHNLQRHSLNCKAPNDKKPFKCNICDFSSKWKHNLERHSLNCTTPKDKKPFKCNSCDFSSKWIQSLQRHTLICTMRKSTQKGIRQEHLRTKNMQEPSTCKTKKAWKCTICQKKFWRAILLKQHLPIHSKERPFKCQGCNLHFKLNSNLRNHSLICSKISSTRKKNLQQHSTVRKNQKALKCAICGKGFVEKNMFGRHLVSHSEKRPFKCNSCDFSTKWLYNLKRHSLAHTNETLFKCKSCDYSSKWKHNLQRHSLNCTMRKSTKKRIRQEHSRTKNMQETSTTCKTKKVWKCTICQKNFRWGFLLKRHLPSHSEERLFKCQGSNFHFKWDSNLQHHISICNKMGSTRKENLKQHSTVNGNGEGFK